MGYKIAVVGATGNVGRVILDVLSTSEISIDEVVALASKESIGKKLSFGDKDITASFLESYDFSGTHIAIFSAGAGISEKYAPIATNAGCIVIDNTSFFRMNQEVPLIIPEVNAEEIVSYKKRNIIANPNCSTIQMLLALSPLHKQAQIKRIVVSTYQSTSGAGKAAMDELYNQTKRMFTNEVVKPKEFTKQIAFNCIPQIDIFMKDGYTKEEWKMSEETKKILGDQIKVSATCVRVPVLIGHSESVNVEFHQPISEKQAYEILSDAKGVLVYDRRKDGGYMTPSEVVQEDVVYVSRIREDNTVEHGLNMWIVADNLRKGAALNAVQIAEILTKQYL